MASYEAYLGVGIDASGAQMGANQFAGATDKVSAAARKAAAANAKFQQQVHQAALMLKFFAVAAAGLTIRSISEYTYAMSSVQAVTKATAADMVQLERITRELGATTQFTASQAAEGAKFLGMAGFTTNQILEALPATLDLAAAAALNMGQAADITSNIMSGFGLAANQAGRAADVLAAIASSANTDVTGMGQAMKYVGPIARSLGISMEDTAAAIGVLANQGIQGSMAGTGLKTSLSALVNPSKAAQAALKSLNLTTNELNPQFNRLDDIIRKLAESGLDAERAFQIFGQRGATAMLALTGDIPGLEKLIGVTNAAAGSAQRMAKIMIDNVKGDAEILKSALTDLTFIIGDAGLTKAVRGFIQEATRMTTSLGELLSGINKNREQSQALSDVLNVVKNAIIAIMVLKFADWLFVAGNAMRALNLAMSANPYFLVAAGLGTIVLHLRDVTNETSELEKMTRKNEEALLDMVGAHGHAARSGEIALLQLQKAQMRTTAQIRKDMEDIMNAAQARESRQDARFPAGRPAGFADPGTATQIMGDADTKRLAALSAELKQIEDLDDRLSEMIGKKGELYEQYSSEAYKGGRRIAKSLIEGIQSIEKKDIANFLSPYVPGIKTMMGFQTPEAPTDTSTTPKKESMIEGELRNMQLAVELAKNLGAAESELYRIRLNAQALQEARENGQKSISAATQKQIEQAVALQAEETRLTSIYEARKGLDDNLKARLKTATEAVSVAQNMGASESELLRMQLESQAIESSRKMGLQGINAEMQTMIDKIVALTGLAADYKETFESDKKTKEYLQGLQDQLAAEQKRGEFMKQYKGDIAEVNTQMKIYNESKQQGISLTAEQIQQAAELINKKKKLSAEEANAAEASKKAAESQKQWNNQLTYAFKDAIMNSKNLGDALSNLANRVQDILVNKALDRLLGGLLGGFAKGAAFQAGGVTAFASGGVVNSPTMFPMRGGVGLMGEAGAEAIMPLTRTSNGDLGVKAVGGGSTVIAPQITINVSGGTKEQNEDAGKRVSAAVRQAIDDTVVSVIMREKRPGGVLNAA
jgi:TP901 family phage tail tape measure protein